MNLARLRIFLLISVILVARCSSKSVGVKWVNNNQVESDDEEEEEESSDDEEEEEEKKDNDDDDDDSDDEDEEEESESDRNGDDEDDDSEDSEEDSDETRERLSNFYKNGRLNPSEYEDFYDVELTEPATSSEFSDEGGGTGIIDESKRWKSNDGKVIVPFVIDGSNYNPFQKQNILEAMKEIQSKTCVKFIPKGGEGNFLTFKHHPQKGCSSMVGMQGGNQFINLNKDSSCANKKGIIMHEILHALGFHHMHTHSARDRYIYFIEKNIKNFLTNRNYFLNDASKVSSFNTKYDFYSIMHYPPYNNEGKRMIKPQKKYMYYDDFMGQRKALSDGDIDRVNNMYNCKNIGGGGDDFGISRIQSDVGNIGWRPLDGIFHQNFPFNDNKDDDDDDEDEESEDDESEEEEEEEESDDESDESE